MHNKKAKIIVLLRQGKSYNEISIATGASKATISYHAKNLGLAKFVKTTYNWSNIQTYFNEGHTLEECVAQFGFNKASWHKAKQRGVLNVFRPIIPLHDLLVIGRKTSRSHLKSRLLSSGLLEYKCYGSECGLTEWLDKPISLQLEHKNGINNDNRIKNLELLCPNCHSQTATFAGRNKKYKKLINNQE